MGLLSKKDSKLILDPLTDNNPVTIQVLGICSALAITAQLKASVVMAISVIAVLGVGNVVISLMRNIIPSKIRIIVQLVVVAALVIIVDQVLKAYSYELSKTLSVFVGLIITNCIIMGRFEAFALANKPWRSFLDGIGNSLGYGLILIIVGVIREIFGKGTLFAGSGIEMKIIGASPDFLIDTTTSSFFGWYAPNNLMVLPAAALFIIGILIWLQRTWKPKLIDIS